MTILLVAAAMAAVGFSWVVVRRKRKAAAGTTH
jgi:LPXTG-motif cell wall-anchored protein